MFRSFFNVKRGSNCTTIATPYRHEIRACHMEICRSTQDLWILRNGTRTGISTVESYLKVGVSIPSRSPSSLLFPVHHEDFHCCFWPPGLCYFRIWSFHISGYVGQRVWHHIPCFLLLSRLRPFRSSSLKDPIELMTQVPARECLQITVL
jgi:hypothetical protein